jgi:hypothetical protein
VSLEKKYGHQLLDEDRKAFDSHMMPREYLASNGSIVQAIKSDDLILCTMQDSLTDGAG